MELNDKILSLGALEFIKALHMKFNAERLELLEARDEMASLVRRGATSALYANGEKFPLTDWKVAPIPEDLQDRRVEITGPAEQKMIINALNSGANCFMADFEDSLSPTWENILSGHRNIYNAVRKQIDFTDPSTGKEYRLNEKVATLHVRPRGWHLDEKHITVSGMPVSASLFDFGLHFYNNGFALIASPNCSGPYFYLPKMENYREAALWSKVFKFSENYVSMIEGTIRATVLIETLPAAFEMETILYELRDYVAGLNAGRWDYLFSMIKMLGWEGVKIFPDRSALTMSSSFMHNYSELIVKTCHKRGAHAMGGMSAFIPSRKDNKINNEAFQKVKEDKEREYNLGFDGTWVAHPDLVPIARNAFLGTNQKDRQVERNIFLGSLLPAVIGDITEEGVKTNWNVALEYIENWLNGKGAVTINNLMEDAATAEISRIQLWHWLRHDVTLTNGRKAKDVLSEITCDHIVEKDGDDKAFKLLCDLIYDKTCPDFLTTSLYKELP